MDPADDEIVQEEESVDINDTDNISDEELKDDDRSPMQQILER